VHCNSLPLSFFPDIYNEDWFFFAREAAARGLTSVGRARQADYNPYSSPERARREEFGDLLAEGLFALFGEEDPTTPFDQQLRGATSGYWERFIEARHQILEETRQKLSSYVPGNVSHDAVAAALESLAAAQSQLNHPITPTLCVDFLDAWRDDLAEWQTFTSKLNNIRNTCEIMDYLGLPVWTRAGFGDGVMDTLPTYGCTTFPILNLMRRSKRPRSGRNCRSPVGSKPSVS
jgi:hypothetical protein